MNSAVKFLFLPTIDVIFLLTLPDTYPLLVAHLPALLLWAINVCCWRRAKHSNHTAAHWQQPLLSGLPSHRAVSWQGKVGEMGKQACWKAEFVWQYRDQAMWKTICGKRETGECLEWPQEPAPHTEPRALQAFPGCYCFCPEWDLCSAMLFCANDSAWRHWPLHYVATWCSGNKLTVFTVTFNFNFTSKLYSRDWETVCLFQGFRHQGLSDPWILTSLVILLPACKLYVMYFYQFQFSLVFDLQTSQNTQRTPNSV